jgi:hypothetical protein
MQKQISKIFVDKKNVIPFGYLFIERQKKIELVDNMDQTQDDKYIVSLICLARKDFSEQYLMEGRA